MLLLASILAAAVIALLAFANARSGEGARIRRHYAPLLLPVHPVPTAAVSRLVDVADFASLAKLAERHGLFVMHWTRSGTDTFIVQDTSKTYRHRVGASATEPAAPLDKIDVRVSARQCVLGLRAAGERRRDVRGTAPRHSTWVGEWFSRRVCSSVRASRVVSNTWATTSPSPRRRNLQRPAKRYGHTVTV